MGPGGCGACCARGGADDAHPTGFAHAGVFGEGRGAERASSDGGFGPGGRRSGGMDRQAVRDRLRRDSAEGPKSLRDRPRGGTACFLDDGRLAVVRGRVRTWVATARLGGAFATFAGRSRRPSGSLMRTRAFASCSWGGVSPRFGAAGTPPGLCGGAGGVPVRVPVARDGAVAFGVRSRQGVAPGGGAAPGRGPGWPERHDVAPVGASRGTPARRPRPSLRLPLSVRVGVRGARQGCGPGVGAGGHGGDECALGSHRRDCRAGEASASSRRTGRWRGSRGLAPPANLVLLELPPYSPELNPMETVFRHLKVNRLANRVFADAAAAAGACRKAWDWFAAASDRIASIMRRE